MSRAEAHALLDRIRDGRGAPMHEIDAALRQTGDLTPLVAGLLAQDRAAEARDKTRLESA